MKILVLGAGAIGGYFGGRLIQNGGDVTFLVHKKRQAQLLTDGIRIKSRFGDYSGKTKAVLESEVGHDGWDLIILSCKAYSLESAIESIRPAVGKRTAVLPLLNGIAHLERLNREFGESSVLGGLAKIVAALGPDGTINHLNDWCSVTFGEQDGSLSERTQHLQKLFPVGSVKALAVPDIQQKMWEKLVHLSTVAGVASLMRASVGEIASAPGGSELLTRFLESNADISKKEGHPISETFLDEYRKLFQDKTAAYVPSLLRDIERHNRMEGDHILGFMLRLARKHGLDDTLYNVINIHLKAYEARLAADRF